MKHLAALFLALAAGIAPAWADAVSPYVFNMAGLRLARLDPAVSEIRLSCIVMAGDTLVAEGTRSFPVTLLADRTQGFGVDSGPFQLAASHVVSASLLGQATRWQCGLTAVANGRLESLKDSCPGTEESAVACPRAGTEVHTRHSGNY